MKELNLILKYIYIAITAGKHRLVSRPDALFPLVSRSIIRKAEGQPSVKQQQAHHL